MDGALPHFSAPGWLLWIGIFKFLGLWEATPLSAFQHVTAGALGNVRGALGARGNSCLVQSDHLSGQASASQKNLPCSKLGCCAGERRRVNQHHPGPANSPAPSAAVRAPLCRWPVAPQQGKWPVPPRSKTIQFAWLSGL